MSLPITEVDDISSWVDDMLYLVDTYRVDVNKHLNPRQKTELGQFLTPMPIARLMASMLTGQESVVSLLDPCAGIGSLFAASVAELCQRPHPPQEIHITAYEIDPVLAAYLPATLELCKEICEHVHISFTGDVRQEEALTILKDLGFPRQQQNERSALTLLALLDLKSDQQWHEAKGPLRGITQMMNFFDQYYGKKYAPNSRETVRRQTVHQFLDAGLIVGNPDNPNRPINSGQTVYQIEPNVLELLKKYNTPEWDAALRDYLVDIETLQKRYAQERELTRIPVKIVKNGQSRFLPAVKTCL